MTRYRLLDRFGNVLHDSTNEDLAVRVSQMWSNHGYKTVFYSYSDVLKGVKL